MTKLFQQLCYCWSEASIIHTERLSHLAYVDNYCTQDLGFCGQIRSSLDQSAGAFPQVLVAMGHYSAAA